MTPTEIKALQDLNLQLAAEVERCREVVKLVLNTDEAAIAELTKNFGIDEYADGPEIKVMAKCREILSTPNPGAALLAELKRENGELKQKLLSNITKTVCDGISAKPKMDKIIKTFVP